MSLPHDGGEEDSMKGSCKMDRDSSDSTIDEETAMCSENDSIDNSSQSAVAGQETQAGSGTDTCDEEVSSLGLPPIPVPGTSKELDRMGVSERDTLTSKVNGPRTNLTDYGDVSDEANEHPTEDTKKVQRRRRKRTLKEDDSEDECHEAGSQRHVRFVPIVKASKEDGSTNDDVRVTPLEDGDVEPRHENGTDHCSSDYSKDEARDTGTEDDSPEQQQDQDMEELPLEESVKVGSAVDNLGVVHAVSKQKDPNSSEVVRASRAKNQRELPLKRKLSPISEESDFDEREAKKVRSSESDSETSQDHSSFSEST